MIRRSLLPLLVGLIAMPVTASSLDEDPLRGWFEAHEIEGRFHVMMPPGSEQQVIDAATQTVGWKGRLDGNTFVASAILKHPWIAPDEAKQKLAAMVGETLRSCLGQGPPDNPKLGMKDGAYVAFWLGRCQNGTTMTGVIRLEDQRLFRLTASIPGDRSPPAALMPWLASFHPDP